MTIKRRLFFSNILMIVIPVVLSIIISVFGMAVVWETYFKDTRYHIENERELDAARDRIVNMTESLLQEGSESELKDSISRIEDVLEQNSLTLIIFESEKELYRIGESQGLNRNLLDAVWAMGGEGIVSVGNEEVYAESVRVNDKKYTLGLFNTTEYVNNVEGNHPPVIIPILIMLGTLVIIFFTNRFLTKFVFRRIEEPLDILVKGVHQIRDGNLDYKMNYNNKDEFAQVMEDFNEMAERLKESITLVQKQEQNRKELLASISHDLRTPLTSIKAYSEGLLDGVAKTPESQKAYLQIIKTKTEDIDRMVSKLFLFSKMDMGDYPQYPEKLNLEQEILSYVHATEDEYARKGLKIKVEELEKDIEIYADPVLLRSVFSNILDNSLKYKDREQGYARIRGQRHGNEVWIYIEDNGPGVSDDNLPKLFDAFYRTDPSRNIPNKGSGLGLAITAKAIGRMGGSIYAKNSATKGLCIVIKLPILKKGERNESYFNN